MMTMRLRFPIPARLLAGFLANLALLAVGFWLVFRAQFGAASGEIFASIAEPRVQVLVERLSAELRERPDTEWNSLLAAEGQALGMEIALCDGEMQPVAGPRLEMPDEVRQRMQEITPHTRGRSGRPPPPVEDVIFGDNPLADVLGGDFMGLPPDRKERRSDRRPPPGDGGPRPIALDHATYPKVTARTTNPTAYWVISRIPVVKVDTGWLPLILIMRSPTLTAGGAFFDPKPWLYAGLGVLVLSALIWVPLALGLTRSLWRLRTATSRIAEGDFAVEVPDSARRDELGELGRSVQQMAQRLEGHVSGQKRFLGDIAHELCSPIARMHASLGILEQTLGADGNPQRYLEKVSSELQHMSALVNELMSFSKASLKREVALQAVMLAPLVQSVLEREDADPAGFRVQIPPGLQVRADAEMLGRALGNLVRNAIRYGGGSGPVEIHAREQNGRVTLTVRDYGPGVPEQALARLFDPFYRPDAARTRESGGTGLGLAIVKTCVEACEGTASVRNVEDGRGLEVTLSLPALRAS